jgi:hypothetical protein
VHSSKSELGLVTLDDIIGSESNAGAGVADYRDLLAAAVYANQSVELGLFSYTCLQLAFAYDARGIDHKKEPLNGLKAFWSAYDKHRLETGNQRPNARSCTKCDYSPSDMSLLKRCSGKCVIWKKPVYCGRECQAAVRQPTALFIPLMWFST